MNAAEEKILSFFTEEMDKERVASNEAFCNDHEQIENYISMYSYITVYTQGAN